jgi:hypothetical protein
MTQNNDGGPAFPVPPATYSNLNHGMSLRDYFAGQYIAGAFGGEPGSHLRTERAAVDAYAVADAMIAARDTKA